MNQQQSCKTTKLLFSTQDRIKVRKETRTQTGARLILSCSWYERGFSIESSWLMTQDLGRQCISSIPILMVIDQLLVASFRSHAQQWVLQWQFWIYRHIKGEDWNDWNCSNELKLAYFAETTSQHNLAVQRKVIKLGLHANTRGSTDGEFWSHTCHIAEFIRLWFQNISTTPTLGIMRFRDFCWPCYAFQNHQA